MYTWIAKDGITNQEVVMIQQPSKDDIESASKGPMGEWFAIGKARFLDILEYVDPGTTMIIVDCEKYDIPMTGLVLYRVVREEGATT